MEEAFQSKTQKRILAAGILTLMALRLAVAGRTELLPEEAYYWTYSQFLALGYFDHPPMVAWMIWLGTMLCGNTELGVRLVSILMAPVTCWLVVRVAELWFDWRAAVVAGWMFLLAPVFMGIGFMGMPEAPLIFFWQVTLYGVTRALREERAGWWWWAGVGLGGALLSKYTAVVLVPMVFLFLAISPRYRGWLRRPQPWLALTVGLVLFSPVIVWNAQNEWASFAFQSTRAVGQSASGWKQSGWFWLSQTWLATPLLFVLFVMVTIRGCRRESGAAWRFAAVFSLPVMAAFALAGIMGSFRINWTAPAILSLLPAAAALLVELAERRRVWRWTAGAMAIGCVVVLLGAHVGAAKSSLRLLRFTRLGGWQALSEQVRLRQEAVTASTGQRPFVVGTDKYQYAATVGFYLGDARNCVNSLALGAHGLGYRYWTELEQFKGRPAVIVLPRVKEKEMEQLRKVFDRLEEPELVRIESDGRLKRQVYLVIGHGYRPAKSGNPR